MFYFSLTSLLIFTTFVAVEAFKIRKKWLEFGDYKLNIVIGFLTVLSSFIFNAFYYPLFHYISIYRVFDLYDIASNSRLSLAFYFIGLFLFDDFTFYWHHRWSHKIKFIWPIHAVHHSSRFYNYSVGTRNSFFVLGYKYISWIWLIILGFDPIHVLLAMSANSLFQFLLHTKKQLLLFKIMHHFGINTPILHAIHHSCSAQHLDKNFGGILTIWDKLFGTYHFIKEESNVYGLKNIVMSQHPIHIQFDGYLRQSN